MQIFGVVAFIRASNGQTIVLFIYSAYKLTIIVFVFFLNYLSHRSILVETDLEQTVHKSPHPRQ